MVVLKPYLIAILVLVLSCSGKGNLQEPREESQNLLAINEGTEHADPVWSALALLQAGENPLWFEFGRDGPHLIESPFVADLTPYVPWPHAHHIVGMTLWEDYLVMTVNREGFLVFGPATESMWPDDGDFHPTGTELLLYRVADRFWDSYTVGSFFLWDNKPAALLYRNDFFAGLRAPPLSHQVNVLDFSSPVPVGELVPALEKFPDGGIWETELLRRGFNGFWYYRMRKKGGTQNETVYLRVVDLHGEGERISFDEWMNSDHPESIEKAPPNLALILAHAAGSGRGGASSVRVISPDFEGQRFFGSAANLSFENSQLLFAYSRAGGNLEKPDPPASWAEPLTLAILSDGSGFCSFGAERDIQPFSLFPLPEGFVYTGVAVLGNVVVASWEEQQEAGIGAAGFMVVNLGL